MPIAYPQLRYLGMISKPDCSEYGFQIEDPDKTLRLIVMTIANSMFLNKQLMIQEAPDLCYQKLLTDLRDAAVDLRDERPIPICESDIAHYRAFHPIMKAHGKAKQPL